MSLPLVDFRCKLTHRTDAVLDAMHMATGRDRSELAREALDAWAEMKIHEASLIDARLKREGGPGIAGGIAGSVRDSQGAPWSAGLTHAYMPSKGAA